MKSNGYKKNDYLIDTLLVWHGDILTFTKSVERLIIRVYVFSEGLSISFVWKLKFRDVCLYLLCTNPIDTGANNVENTPSHLVTR